MCNATGLMDGSFRLMMASFYLFLAFAVAVAFVSICVMIWKDIFGERSPRWTRRY